MRLELPVVALARRIDEEAGQTKFLRQSHDDRAEIEIIVADVDRDGAILAHVAKVNLHRLAGEQMGRHRVSAEGIQHQHIELLRRFIFQRKPRVTGNHLDLGSTVGQKREVIFRKFDHCGIYLIEPIIVGGASVDGDRASAHSDRADVLRAAAMFVEPAQGVSDAAGLVIVGRRLPPAIGGIELHTVDDLSMHHRDQAFVGPIGCVAADGDNPVEVSFRRIGRRLGGLDALDVHDDDDAEHQQATADDSQRTVARATGHFTARRRSGLLPDACRIGQYPGRQREADRVDDVQFVKAMQQPWADHGHQQAAYRAAGGAHQVEHGQALGTWFQPHQFAMAEHADTEHGGEADQNFQQILLGKPRVGTHSQRKATKQCPRGEDRTYVPARIVKADDECQQVQTERDDPQKRCRRSVDQLTYSEFVFSLENPTCFNLLKADPLEGNLILDINPSILYPIIDRMLGGGKESGAVSRRPLTEIELRLVRKITTKFLAELKRAWANVLELNLEVERVESNPQLVQIVPPNEVVVLISFELAINDVRGMMNLCVPFNSIERISNRLTANNWGNYGRSAATEESIGQIGRRLDHANVELVVTLAESTISTKDLIELRVGDIITTDVDVEGLLEVSVAGLPKFEASPGAFRGQKAIQIERTLETPAKPAKAAKA